MQYLHCSIFVLIPYNAQFFQPFHDFRPIFSQGADQFRFVVEVSASDGIQVVSGGWILGSDSSLHPALGHHRIGVSDTQFGRYDAVGAFLHGDDQRLLSRTIQSGQWDLVLHGHTHVAAQYRQGSTLVVNPGAIQRTGSPSVAVIDLPSLEVTEVPL